MNLASILNLIGVLVTHFPEIQALFNRIWEEIDKGLEPGVVSGLNVMGHTAQFSPEFIKEIQNKHDKAIIALEQKFNADGEVCLLYTSPSPRDQRGSRMPSSA